MQYILVFAHYMYIALSQKFQNFPKFLKILKLKIFNNKKFKIFIFFLNFKTYY
jgi:hypothetical protein